MTDPSTDPDSPAVPAEPRPLRPLTGRVPADAVRRCVWPRLSVEVIARFQAIDDLTGAVSDALDELGLVGAIPASVLAPSLGRRRMVGQAVTVRNVERSQSPAAAAAGRQGRMGEHEAYNQADPGDVVVIEGLTGVSNMGGQSAALAHRAGCIGAVIDGSCRDPDSSRERGFPIWSRGVTPITGKWRLETVGINGRVRIAGVAVEAGDLVVADEAGVVFVPLARAEEVLREAERITAGDARQKADIAAGIGLAALASTRYK